MMVKYQIPLLSQFSRGRNCWVGTWAEWAIAHPFLGSLVMRRRQRRRRKVLVLANPVLGSYLLTPQNLYNNILNVFFIQFSLYFLRPSLKHKIFLLSISTTSQWVSKHFSVALKFSQLLSTICYVTIQVASRLFLLRLCTTKKTGSSTLI